MTNLALATLLFGTALAARSAPPPAPALPAQVTASIDPDRTFGYVESLAGFGTRHVLSDTQSPTRGIGAARQWIKRTMESFNAGPGDPGHLTVTLEEFDVPKMPRLPEGAKIANVIAVLPGSSPQSARRAYYVVGHYDSRNGDAMDAVADAPGANDDASGTAVVMTIARALAHMPLKSTVVFLCTAAEEQGLIGARMHAERSAVHKDLMICAVLNNDIVGDPSPPGGSAAIVRVFSEGLPRTLSAEQLSAARANSSENDSPSRELARYVAEIAVQEQTAIQPKLIFRPDRFLRGGDHTAFNDIGVAAVRFTVPTEDYSRQHANVTQRDGKPYGDTPEFVNKDYVNNVARLNAAVLVHLANAPSSPSHARIVTAELGTATTLRWDASPEPDVAGYEVVWRETTSPTWDHAKDVGKVTEITLEMNKDDLFFGIRAYGTDGYKSPVSFAVAAPK